MNIPRSKTVKLTGERDLATNTTIVQVPSDEDLEQCHLQLDFGNVDYISSLDLGMLVSLHRRLQGLGGKLTLLNVNRDLYDRFKATRLDSLLDIQA